MAESLRDLVVSLSLKSDSFTQNLKMVNALLRESESEFKLAGAGVKNFESSTQGTQAKIGMLTTRLNLQKQAFAQYQGQLNKAKTSLETNSKANAEYKAKLDACNKALAEAKEKYGENSEEVEKLKKEHQEFQRQIDTTAKAMQTAATNMITAQTNLNKTGAAIKETEAEIARLNDEMKRANWNAFNENVAKAGQALTNFGNAAMAVGQQLKSALTDKIVAFGQEALDASIAYETAFTTIRQVTNETEDGYAAIDSNAKRLAVEVGMSADEVASVMAEAGRLGISGADELAEFTRTSIMMAESFNLNAEDTATSVARFRNISGMAIEDVTNYGSAVTYLANNYATTADEIIEMSQGLIGAATSVGMSQQDVLGISTALTSVGITAGRGATTFSQAMLKIETSVKTGDEYLDDFAKVAGMSVEEFKRAWEADPGEVMIRFIQGLAGMNDEAIDAIPALQECGIKQARLTDTMLRAAGSVDMFDRAMSDANSAWSDGTVLQTTFDKRMGTTAKKIEQTSARFNNFKIVVGDDVKGAFTGLLSVADGILEWLLSLDEGTRKMVEGIAAVVAAIGPLVIGIGLVAKVIGVAMTGLASISAALAAVNLATVAATAGIVVLGAAVIAGTVALVDWASGARAAREAVAGLNTAVSELGNNRGIYEGVSGNVLQSFGLSADNFRTATEAGRNWFDEMYAVWTDGAYETDDIVRQWTSAFTDETDRTRQNLEEKGSLLSGLGVLDGDTAAQMQADMQTLDDIDAEVAALLRRRQGGFLTDEEQARLQEIIALRDEINQRWGVTDASNGYDSIYTQFQATLSRLGTETGDGTSNVSEYGRALIATAQGYQTTLDDLTASYDEQYGILSQIEDEETRTAALGQLLAQYGAARTSAASEYLGYMQQIAGQTIEDNNLTSAIETATNLRDAIDDIRKTAGESSPDLINGVTAYLDGLGSEGLTAFQSLYSLIMQLKAAEMTDSDIASLLGMDDESFNKMMTDLQQVKETAASVTELAGLNTLFGNLDENAAEVISMTLDVNTDDARTIIDGFIAEYEADPIDITSQATIDAVNTTYLDKWKAAHGNEMNLATGFVNVVPQFGDAWDIRLEALWENGMVSDVFGPDGVKLDITPEVLEEVKLHPEDCFIATREDGKIVVVITPKLGTPEFLTNTETEMNTEQGGYQKVISDLTGMPNTTAGKLEDVYTAMEHLNQVTSEYSEVANSIDGAPWYERLGTYFSHPIQYTQVAGAMDTVGALLTELNDTDIDNIASRIMALGTALLAPEGTYSEEDLAAIREELEQLATFADTLNSTGDGEHIAEGIAQGMVNHEWQGDANELADDLGGAIRSAFGIESPAKTMLEPGGYIAAGLGKGMSTYDFSSDASSIVNNVKSAFPSDFSDFNSIGYNMVSGMAVGVANGTSILTNAIRNAVRSGVSAAKDEAVIKSPSHVFRDEIGAMMMEGMGVGIEMRAKKVAQTVANATRYVTNSAAGVIGGSTTNNRTYNNSSTLNLSVDGLSIRDESDIYSLAVELAQLTNRNNALKGVM